MPRPSAAVALTALAPLLWTGDGAIQAAEIKALSVVVMRTTLDDVVRQFEARSGHKVTIRYGTAGDLRQRIQAGEAADIAIVPRPVLDHLASQGHIASGSSVDLAYSTIALAVRSGAPKPDISSIEALDRKSVV